MNELIEVGKDSPTWKHVLDFALKMESKLALNRHKGGREGWLKDSVWDLFYRLKDEVKEVEDALSYQTSEELVKECADVANFAMMIADRAMYNVPAKADGWKTIETAPKDGSVILAVYSHVVVLAYWSKASSMWEHEGYVINPDYWMPLPPLPIPL